MAFKRGLMPTLLDQEGLFARKSSSNILSDPRILEHLRNVAQEAQIEDADEEYESDDSDNELEKRELYEKVRAYNSRSQVGAFGITQHVSNILKHRVTCFSRRINKCVTQIARDYIPWHPDTFQVNVEILFFPQRHT